MTGPPLYPPDRPSPNTSSRTAPKTTGVGDGNFNSQTAEDRFFGVSNPDGISAIKILCIPEGGGSGIEVDHLQYGPYGDNKCLADLDDDNTVGVNDLLQLLAVWGSCPGCPEDLDNDDNVGVSDLLTLLGAWGPC